MILFGFMPILLEWPLPAIHKLSLHGSVGLRIAYYLVAAVMTILVYQSVDSALFFAISAAMYGKALALGQPISDTHQKPSTSIV